MAPKTVKFRLKPGVNAISFGSSPRISLKAGKVLSTADPRLIDALNAHPHVEVAKATRKKATRKKAAPAEKAPVAPTGGEV